jgi:hypothetical protein
LSRTIEPITRWLYDGRTCLGRIQSVRDGNGFEAFDAADKPLGRFNDEAAAGKAMREDHHDRLAR